MSIDFIYNSEYNKVMSGGYMTDSGIFKENINVENIVNYKPNLAVPVLFKLKEWRELSLHFQK